MALARFGLNRLLLAPYLRNVAVSRYSDTRRVIEQGGIPSSMEQSTGLERKELEALMAGIENPFNMGVHSGAPGTKDKPQLVPSMLGERIVGCVCEEDATYINWMVLKSGPARRCECGHWFKLVEGNTTNLK